MTRPKKADGTVEIRVLIDGLFIEEDVRRDAGDIALVPEDVAAILIERKHAKRV